MFRLAIGSFSDSIPVPIPWLISFTKMLQIIRTLRVVRFISVSRKLQAIYATLNLLFGALIKLTINLSIFYYAFAIIGMELWAGKLVKDNPKLLGTSRRYSKIFYLCLWVFLSKLYHITIHLQAYYGGRYYEFVTFNNLYSTAFLLFHQMIVNNWSVTMEATGSIVYILNWLNINWC